MEETLNLLLTGALYAGIVLAALFFVLIGVVKPLSKRRNDRRNNKYAEGSEGHPSNDQAG